MFIDSESEQEFQVQRILKKKVSQDGQNIFYLVHWKGYSEQQATWEPLENLTNAIEYVQSFQRKIWNDKKLDYQQKNYQSQIEMLNQKQFQRKKQSKKFINKQRKKSKKRRKKNYNNDQKCTLQELNNLNFEIIGAKKPEIILYIKFADGQIKQISSRQLMKIEPEKIMNFYEKHILKRKQSIENSAKQQK